MMDMAKMQAMKAMMKQMMDMMDEMTGEDEQDAEFPVIQKKISGMKSRKEMSM